MQEAFPWEAVETNVHGTTNLVNLSLKHNIEKTFNKMLELGRSIADAWDMKLCDETFNTISEQRISEYKNEAHEVDLKNGSYGG